MMVKPYKETPGNAKQSAEDYAQYWYRVGVVVADLEKLMRQQGEGQMRVHEIKVQKQTPGDGMVRVIVKAIEEGKQTIGFHSDYDVAAALTGAIERAKRRDMTMYEDEYASDKVQ